jgi:hypothetical protein
MEHCNAQRMPDPVTVETAGVEKPPPVSCCYDKAERVKYGINRYSLLIIAVADWTSTLKYADILPCFKGSCQKMFIALLTNRLICPIIGPK